jgi:hypothetical protein
MRNHTIIALTCAAGLLLPGCDDVVGPTGIDDASQDLVQAGDRHRRGATIERPFLGTWKADGPPPPPIPAPSGVCGEGALGYQYHTFTGKATHIGRFTMGVGLCDFGIYYEGTATLTAANGDEIDMVFTDGRVISVAPPFMITRDEFTFTGGTGRFASVSGGGYEVVHFDMRVGYGTGTMRGTISYNASDRSRKRGHNR